MTGDLNMDFAQTETLRLAMSLLADDEYSEASARRALVATTIAMGCDQTKALIVTLNAARALAEMIRQSGNDEMVEGARRMLLNLAVAGMDEDWAA